MMQQLSIKNKTPFERIKSETELIEYAYSFDLELSDFLYLLSLLQKQKTFELFCSVEE